MALLDNHYLTVETESPSYPVAVTEQPVEKGINLIDHVQAQARTLALSGIIAGPDAAKVRAYILSVKDKGQVIKYVGRNAFTGLITAFDTTHDYAHANGMTFTMELREVRVATTAYAETLPPPVKAQVVPIVNSGTKQTKSNKKAGGSKKKSGSGKKEKEKPPKVTFKAGSKWGGS
ncbi:hypothetical protein PA598K_01334 [Paenibacillus sp. 598K]|uniref:phage baseplate protein n=1 Tax=Paenibacillus sp. 598K TaxID=1117987 RepID=UPI000FFA8142|nr:hypothetical protein [Paenibacillus sp. 598K]GBF73049.1 hypothetical protein PA598K_01334 [Paenibacillus sp. 598K]